MTPTLIRGYGARNLHRTGADVGTDRSDAPSWVSALCGERVWRPVRCDDARRHRCERCEERAATIAGPSTLDKVLDEAVATLHLYGPGDKHHRLAVRRIVAILRPDVDVDDARAVAALFRELNPETTK